MEFFKLLTLSGVEQQADIINILKLLAWLFVCLELQRTSTYIVPEVKVL